MENVDLTNGQNKKLFLMSHIFPHEIKKKLRKLISRICCNILNSCLAHFTGRYTLIGTKQGKSRKIIIK